MFYKQIAFSLGLLLHRISFCLFVRLIPDAIKLLLGISVNLVTHRQVSVQLGKNNYG